LTQLALYLPIEDLLIPPSAYLQDRKLTADIHSPYVTGKRAFSARNSLPVNFEGKRRLPRVIRETTSFVLMEKVIDTEGIFRISAPAKLKEVLREAYDRGQKFIVWKDHESCLPLPKYTNAMESDAILEEIDSTETYGPHIAAGLIKLWYSELREPMVPQPAYKELVRLHGDAHITPSLDQLVDLISPQSEWSPLPAISRELLVRHLLPVLSAVASHEDNNKMTPDNLAVCFAPTFVCGPDQMEDVKISAIIRRLLAVLVTMWPQLLEKCDVDPKALWEDLRAPSNIDDYEDPLEENRITPPAVGPVDIETQQSGIILNDNNIQEPVEVPSSDTKSQLPDPSQLPPRTAQMELTLNTNPPPLPPRSGNEWPTAPGSDNDPGIRRKPTPTQGMPPQGIAIQGMPPRYSTVFGGEASGSPSSYIGPVDGFGPPRRGDWSLHASDNELNAAKILNNDSTDSLFAKPSPLQTVAPNSFVPNVVVPIVVASNVVPPNVVVPIPVVKRKPVASSENVKEGSGSGPAIERPKES
jgi:Rho GTPase-activating protein 1